MTSTARYADAVQNSTGPVVQVFKTAASNLGAAIIHLVNILDLDLVTLSEPGLAQLGDEYRRDIDEHLNRTGFLRDIRPTTVRLGAGGADAGALGAASVVLHRELTPHHWA